MTMYVSQMKKKAEGRGLGLAVWFCSDDLTNMTRHAQAKADLL